MSNWNPPPSRVPPPPGGSQGGGQAGGSGSPGGMPPGFVIPPPHGVGGPGTPAPLIPTHTSDTTSGNVALGFLVGFFGGCVSWALVFMFAKGYETKKGALIGFMCQLFAILVWRALHR